MNGLASRIFGSASKRGEGSYGAVPREDLGNTNRLRSSDRIGTVTRTREALSEAESPQAERIPTQAKSGREVVESSATAPLNGLAWNENGDTSHGDALASQSAAKPSPRRLNAKKESTEVDQGSKKRSTKQQASQGREAMAKTPNGTVAGSKATSETTKSTKVRQKKKVAAEDDMMEVEQSADELSTPVHKQRSTHDAPSASGELEPTQPRSSGRQRKLPKWLEESINVEGERKQGSRSATPRSLKTREQTPRTTKEQESDVMTSLPDVTNGKRKRVDTDEQPKKRGRPRKATTAQTPKKARGRVKALGLQEGRSSQFEVETPRKGSMQVASDGEGNVDQMGTDVTPQKAGVQRESRLSSPSSESGQDELRVTAGDVEESITTVSATEYEGTEDVARDFRDYCTRKKPHKHLRALSQIVLERLNGRRLIPLQGLEEEYKKVHQLVQQTVVAGEGNSMLLLGARGSGKTTLVETVISDLSSSHAEDFHVIRLNGFLQTDDKLALREIWRQLGREMDVEDDEKPTNYADTLASLLALLSHPSELAQDITKEEQGKTAKSVIFIMDEFDLFASHPRQTLLYNLFDIAQARKAPIAVLGLTTRVNVAESLEKRVKSRFSHRWVYLPLAKSLPTYVSICKSALLLTESELLHNSSGGEMSALRTKAGADLVQRWNTYLTHLFRANTSLQSHLHALHVSTKTPSTFFASALLPIATLYDSTFSEVIQVPDFSCLEPLMAPDSLLSVLPSLSTLELALLIAAARLSIIYDTDTVTFLMVYEEYVKVASRSKLQAAASGAAASGVRIWGKDVAVGSWERLGELELVARSSSGGGNGRDGLWRIEVGLEEIEGSMPDGLGMVMSKWCREL